MLKFMFMPANFLLTYQTVCTHILLKFVVIPHSQTGSTPLFVAAQNGHRTTAELLISKGADINLPNKVK